MSSRRDKRTSRLRSRRWLLLAASVVAISAAVIAGVVVALQRGGPAQPVQVGVPSLSEGSFQETAGKAVPTNVSGKSPITGEQVSLADFKGKPVVINIWASWCAPCREEAPDIKRFVDAHPEMTMLGIDIQDNAGDARAFYREFGWEHPSIDDPRGVISLSFGLLGLPTTIFLTRRHREVARIVGATDLAGFEKGLNIAKGPSGD